MKKCNNCNKIYGDAETFCPKCGLATVNVEPAEPEQSVATDAAEFTANKPKKKKTGLFVGIALAVVVALVAVFVIVGSKLLNTPMAQFMKAQRSFAAGSIGHDDNLNIESVLKGQYERDRISTDATVTLSANDEETNDRLSNFSMLLKLDQLEAGLNFGAELNYKGSPVLSGTMEFTDELLSFYVPELSDKFYALDVAAIERSSPYYVESDTNKNDYTELDDLEKAYNSLKSKYESVILKGFSNADFTREKITAELANIGEQLRGASRITYTPNESRVSEMLKALADELENDEMLSNYLLSLADKYASGSLLGYYQMLVEDDSEADNEQKTETDGTGLVPKLNELAKSIRENADDMAKNIVNANFTWSCTIYKNRLVAQNISWDGGSFEYEKYNAKEYLSCKHENAFSIKYDVEELDGKLNGSIELEFLDRYNDTIKISGEYEGVDKHKKSGLLSAYGKTQVTIEQFYRGDPLFSITMALDVKAAANGGTEHDIKIKFNDGTMPLGMIIDDSDAISESELGITITTTDQPSTLKLPDIEKTLIDNEKSYSDMAEELSKKLFEVILRLSIRLGI